MIVEVNVKLLVMNAKSKLQAETAIEAILTSPSAGLNEIKNLRINSTEMVSLAEVDPGNV